MIFLIYKEKTLNPDIWSCYFFLCAHVTYEFLLLQVLVTNLDVESVTHLEPANFWIGPSAVSDVLKLTQIFVRFCKKMYVRNNISGYLYLKYGSEVKGSSLCRCSILIGFIMSKNLRGLWFYLLIKVQKATSLVFLT